MSIFVVDPEKYAESKGNIRRNPFVNSRFGYVLTPDLKSGFKQAVRNQQNALALEYMDLMFDVLDELIADLLEQKSEVTQVEDSTAKSRKTSKASGPQPEEKEQEAAAS